MLRTAAGQICKLMRPQLIQARAIATTPKRFSHGGEPDIHSDSFDDSYVQFFSKPDIDGWLVRKAALHACRRINDYALAIRWLEGCRNKCGDKKDEIYPWLLQEIQPTLKELGVLTPEEMGYGAPELALKSVFDRT
ncbi:Cytochrome c oxidase subunit 5A, mitochondrial, partial [Pseudolycoriella hygida]